MNFMTIEALKAQFLVDTIHIKRNKETGKLFAVVGTTVMKVQQSFDPLKPTTVMYESVEDLNSYCICNYDPDKEAEDVFKV